MDRDMVGRRDWLRTAGLAAGGVALGTTLMPVAAHADDGSRDRRSHGHRISGTWMNTAVIEEAGFVGRSVTSLARGGVVVHHDISPAGPPFTGTWARTGPRSYRFTSWSGFAGSEGPGSPGLIARLEVEGALGDDDTVSGTFTYTEIDPVSDEPVRVFTGTFTGTRVTA